MTITRQNLEGKFRLFNDEELRRLYHSGDLTELAREVAAAELQQRGLDLAKPQVAVASEQPSKTPTEPAAVDLFQLLFGFSGRINRAKYWLAVVIYSVAVLIVPVILFSFSVALVSTDLAPLLVVVAVIVSTPLLISGIAISIKRLHDRDKSGWWLLVFYVLPAVLSHIAEAAGTEALQFIFSLASFALSIWGFVEIGCLRGNVGPNKYGSDPLAS